MESGRFSPGIEEFLLALHRQQVRFLIVGGEAAIFYGYPRLTGGLDLCFDGSKENTQRLHEALEEFWGGSVPGILAYPMSPSCAWSAWWPSSESLPIGST
jgi:hypothetical protein